MCVLPSFGLVVIRWHSQMETIWLRAIQLQSHNDYTVRCRYVLLFSVSVFAVGAWMIVGNEPPGFNSLKSNKDRDSLNNNNVWKTY